MEKVFGIGLNKTGTTTLGTCMKALGYRHLSHSRELTELYHQGRTRELMDVARNFDSFEDWPWPLLYKDLADEFPKAKFILTVRRSPSTWLQSLITHAYKLPPEENYHELVYGYKYPLGHKRYHLDFYNGHNAAVHEHFQDRPERLRELCWERGDSWPELTSFLGVDAPEMAFPHAGATTEWEVPRARIVHNRLLALRGMFSAVVERRQQ